MDPGKLGRSSSETALASVDQADLEALKGFIQKGDLNQARERAEVLLQAHPGSAQLYNILGIVALSSGDNEKARVLLQKALELSPNFTGAAANLGVALMRSKQLDAAIDVLREAIRLEPGSIQARANLANAYLNAKQFQQAFDQSTELLKLAPDNLEFLKIRATAAVETGDWPTVHAVLDRIEAVSGPSDWSVPTRFKALADSGRTEEAVAYGEANARRHPTVFTPLGELMIELGRFDEARNWLRMAVRHNPDDTEAYFQYGRSKRWSEDDPMLEQLKASADRFARTNRDGGGYAFFALAKAYMDLARHDAVFPALRKANEFQGRGWRFDFEAQARQAQHIRDTWTADSITALSGVGVEDVSPIFIIGMPRSGSTLTEHVIEAHPEVTSIGEGSFTAPFFPTRMAADREILAEASQAASKEVRKLAGPGRRLLDKYLYNYQRIGSLAAAFPNARFVQTRRDPRSIALSIYSNPLGVQLHPYSTELRDIGRFYVQYHLLMEYWKSILGDRIIVSDYQTLVEDPEPNIRALIARLGLPWDDACLKPEAVQKRVRTLSVVQVRSGIHSGAVERWRHYEAELAPFTEIVSSVWDFDRN